MKDNKIYLTVLITLSLFTGCVQTSKNYKYSPLHNAVMLNQFQNVKILLPDSNINELDSFKESPIVDAIRNNSSEISKILICNGADLNITDSNNNTLIDLAISNNNTEILELLKNPTSPTLCTGYRYKKQEIKPIIKKDYISINKEIKEINLVKKFDKINKNKNNNLIEDLSKIKLSNKDSFNKEELTYKFTNSGDLNDDFKNRLNDFKVAFIKILKKYNNKIENVNIKNYTSSEFRSRKTVIGKFMANSKISQTRANKIVNMLSNNLDSIELKNKIKPLGMSSQNLIKNSDGSENNIKSRRTEIEIVLK